METLTDSELLNRWSKDRDEAAFAAIVRRHAGLVQGVCHRTLGDADRAADAAQAVFLLLSQKAARISAEPSLAGWLFVAARHAARNVARGERRRRDREHHAVMMNLPPDPRAAGGPALDAHLAALPAADRQALLLRFYEDRSLAEIGARLGTSENAARMRVSRALEKLRARLTRAGLAIGVAPLEDELIRSLRHASEPADVDLVLRHILAQPAPTSPLANLTLKTMTISALAKPVLGGLAILALTLAVGGAARLHTGEGERPIPASLVRAAFQRLRGDYRGELTYLDETTGRGSTVPLTVRVTTDGARLRNVTKFPGSPEYDNDETVTVDSSTGEIVTRDKREITRAVSDDFRPFAENRRDAFATRWAAQAEGKPAWFRETFRITPTDLLRRKEIARALAGPWTLSDESKLVRVR